MSTLAPLSTKPLPPAPPFRKLIGPSFIILGVGLGSGELILWPYLSSNFGLGIIWAALVGITLQFIINMEIERYSLAVGESVFSGFTRKWGGIAPIWFILSTFIPWMWPGIIASSARLLSASMGMEYSPVPAIALLILMGGIFSLGHVVYKTQESLQKAIIIIGVPFILFLTFFLAKPADLSALAEGVVGKGDGFWFLPVGLPLGTFLTALAYAGAGGNLNLAQSLYIREKGYGMGFYSDKITNILAQKNKKEISLSGNNFEINEQNLTNFKTWWRRINLEHALVFWITGAFTMLLLSLLAYSTVYGSPNTSTSINFVIEEAKAISTRTIPALATAFLGIGALMLFGTQFSVYGSNSRIMAENLCLISPKFKTSNLSKYFYSFLWFQIICGIIIFLLGFKEPLGLLVISGVLNAFSMFIYTGLLMRLNSTSLPKEIRPGNLRTLLMITAFLFYGCFSLFTIVQNLQKLI
jgi:hypothetical protein